MSNRIRIGAVSYLNTRPLVFGLDQGLGAERIDLSYDVPAKLAEQMSAGLLDVALLPVVELARMPDLEIIPGLGIVTFGACRSVLIVSRRPLEEIESVALDPESRTSNILARLLLAERLGRLPIFRRQPAGIDKALSDCDAAIRIGDKALFEAPPAGSFVYDLGEMWTETTGMPFVFAAWITRPGAVDREIYRWLHESLRRGSRVIDLIAEDYTWRGRRDPQLAADYLTRHIRFRLGQAELDAMRRFFGSASACGLLERTPSLRMAFGSDSACHRVVEASESAFGTDGNRHV